MEGTFDGTHIQFVKYYKQYPYINATLKDERQILPLEEWEVQYTGVWIRNWIGGGGCFKGIWTIQMQGVDDDGNAWRWEGKGNWQMEKLN